jgi:hypothetical protein
MEPVTNKRYFSAMAAYAVLAALAALTLDGKMRVGVLILMAALAVKTHIARKAGW